MRILNWLYNAAILPLSIFAWPLFMLRARGRARLKERYGFWNLSKELRPGEKLVWFHGASMGEINGLIPVIKLFRKQFPQFRVLLSATSINGLEKGKEVADITRMLPFDSPVWLHFALGGISVELFAVSETELWPCLLEYLQKKGTKVALINAIISDFSFNNYRALKPLLAAALDRMDLVLTMDEKSRERFIELGVQPGRVRTAGNSKYDIRPSVTSRDVSRELRAEYFTGTQPVLTLGSIRPGEEDFWLPALRDMWLEKKPFNVIFAPRHSEKFEFFAAKLRAAGIPFRKRSARKDTGISAGACGEMVLLDTLGELEKVYSFSDISFIGGTLIDWGGHNPLEAAAYGSAVVLGPGNSRIRDIVEMLQKNQALLEVSSLEDVKKLVEDLAAGNIDFKSLGEGARRTFDEASGATLRIIDGIRGLL